MVQNFLLYAENFWGAEGHHIMVLTWALCLGSLIGIERQWRQRLAGVRTNALVSVGACCFTLFAASLPNPGVDSVARVAAQIVSGIGFLGAGVIMRDGFSVHGLTTAATLWCAAAVGVLAGSDMIGLAVISTSVILFINLFLRPLSRAIDAKARHPETKEINVITVESASENEAEIKKVLNHLIDVSRMQWISWRVSKQDHQITIVAKIAGLGYGDPQGHHIMQTLSSIDGVSSVDFQVEKGLE